MENGRKLQVIKKNQNGSQMGYDDIGG